jgi:hypothetical protein
MRRESVVSGRPRKQRLGKLFIILSLIGVVVVLAAGAFTWRQVQLGSAKQELRDEVDALQAQFAGVDDWKQWYLNRLQGDWGGDAYVAWCRSLEARSGLSTTPGWADSSWLESSLNGRASVGPAPTEAELREFLDATAAFAGDADALLHFDDLSGVPEFTDDQPTFPFMDEIAALNVLMIRAQVYAHLGESAAAWAEWRRLAGITERMRADAALLEYLLNVSKRKMTANTFELLAARLRTPEGITAYSKPEIAPDRLAECMRLESAYIHQYYARGFNWDDPGDEWEDSFSPRLHQDEATDTLDRYLFRPGREYHLAAEQIRTMRLLATNSKDPPKETESWIEYLSGQPADGRARHTLSTLRACLVFALRTHEASGEALETYVPDPEFYSDYRVERSKDGWMVVHFTPSESVKGGLRSGHADVEEYFEEVEPIRIRPLN